MLGACHTRSGTWGHESRQPTIIRRNANESTYETPLHEGEQRGNRSIAISSPAIAQSMPEIRWRLAASWPRSLDVPFGACETLAKYVAEAMDNKFQIQLFAAGEIVPALQVLDAVQNGSVETCHTATY